MAATYDSDSAGPTARRARGLLVLPGALWTLVFFLAPLGLLFVYSFASIDLLTFQVTFGWTTRNYTEIVDGLYLGTIVRSLAVSVAATAVCLVIGFPVALAIARQTGRRQTLLLVALMVPFWTSFVVRTYGLVNLLADSGPIADLLRAVGLIEDQIRILYTPWGVGIGIVYAYLPLMVLPLFVALERVDPATLDAAADLGASPRRRFRKVVVPLAMPGIVAGCVLVGIPATGEYVIPAILGGDKTLLYGNVVANQFLGVGDYPFGSALAISLMVIVTGVVAVTRRRSAAAEAVA